MMCELDVLIDSNLISDEPPKHYPFILMNTLTHLRSIETTFEVLNNFIDVTNENLKSSNLNDNNFIAYCGVYGINYARIHKLIDRGFKIP